MCITFINNSVSPRNATLKISVNINHLHLSTWHFAKIRQLYLKLQLFDLNLFDFFLSIFMRQEFKKKKKHSYCLMKTAGNGFQRTENYSPIPIRETWILKSQFFLGWHPTFYLNYKHSGNQLFQELKEIFNLKLTELFFFPTGKRNSVWCLWSLHILPYKARQNAFRIAFSSLPSFFFFFPPFPLSFFP